MPAPSYAKKSTASPSAATGATAAAGQQRKRRFTDISSSDYMTGFVSASAMQEKLADANQAAIYKGRWAPPRSRSIPELRLTLHQFSDKKAGKADMIFLKAQIFDFDQTLRSIRESDDDYLKSLITEDGKGMYMPFVDKSAKRNPTTGEMMPGEYEGYCQPILLKEGALISMSKIVRNEAEKAFKPLDSVVVKGVQMVNRVITDKTPVESIPNIDPTKFYTNFAQIFPYQSSSTSGDRLSRAVQLMEEDDAKLLEPLYAGQFASRSAFAAGAAVKQQQQQQQQENYMDDSGQIGVPDMDDDGAAEDHKSITAQQQQMQQYRQQQQQQPQAAQQQQPAKAAGRESAAPASYYSLATPLMQMAHWNEGKNGGKPLRQTFRIEMMQVIAKALGKQDTANNKSTIEKLVNKTRSEFNGNDGPISKEQAEKVTKIVKPFLEFDWNLRQYLKHGSDEFLRVLIKCSIFDQDLLKQFGIANPISFADIMGTHPIACVMVMTPLVDETLKMNAGSSIPRFEAIQEIRARHTTVDAATGKQQQDTVAINQEVAQAIVGVQGRSTGSDAQCGPLKMDAAADAGQMQFDVQLKMKAVAMVVDVPTWVRNTGMQVDWEDALEYLVKRCMPPGAARDALLADKSEFDPEMMPSDVEIPLRDEAYELNVPVNVESVWHASNALNLAGKSAAGGAQQQQAYNLSEYTGDVLRFFRPVTLQVPVIAAADDPADASSSDEEDGEEEDEEEEGLDAEEKPAKKAKVESAIAAAAVVKMEEKTFRPFDFYVLGGDGDMGTKEFNRKYKIELNPKNFLLGMGGNYTTPSRVLFAVSSDELAKADEAVRKHKASAPAAAPRK
jgi:hypothetical protein